MDNSIELIDFGNKSYKEIKDFTCELDLFNMPREKVEQLYYILGKDNRKNVLQLANRIFTNYEKTQKEKNRVLGLYDFDRSFLEEGYVAGVDEVGRGPLAGPIVGAAVILDLRDLQNIIWQINDSKALRIEKREELAKEIQEKALSYSISVHSNEDIDSKGISFCNNNVLKSACENLKITPSLVLSDGYLVRGLNIPNKHVIKGDAKSASIACASIIAKVYRDNLMKEYSKEYPYYDFENNAGYGTSKHIEGIHKYGICKIHRHSFLNNIINRT